MKATLPQPSVHPPILSADEVVKQMNRLGKLRDALASLGIQSKLATNRRLSLWFNNPESFRQTGLTAPTLYVFGPNGLTGINAKGDSYTLPTGIALSDDAEQAAKAIAQTH